MTDNGPPYDDDELINDDQEDDFYPDEYDDAYMDEFVDDNRQPDGAANPGEGEGVKHVVPVDTAAWDEKKTEVGDAYESENIGEAKDNGIPEQVMVASLASVSKVETDLYSFDRYVPVPVNRFTFTFCLLHIIYLG